jgi:hypothetical protein
VAFAALLALAACSSGGGGGAPGPGPTPEPGPSVLKASYQGQMQGNVNLPDFKVLGQTQSGGTAQLRSDLTVDVDYDASRAAGSEAALSAEASNLRLGIGFDPGIEVGSGDARLVVNDLSANVALNGTLTDTGGTIDVDARKISFDALEGSLTPGQLSGTWSGSFGNSTITNSPLADVPGVNVTIEFEDDFRAEPKLTLDGSFNSDYSEITGSVGGEFFGNVPTIEDDVDGTFLLLRQPNGN